MDRVGQLAERFIRAALQSNPDVGVVFFIEPLDRKKLLSAFPPVWVHHMTVWHFKEGMKRPDLPWGKTVALKVVQHVGEASTQVVDPPSKLRPRGRTPHVTISTTAGTPPAASNSLLSGKVEPIKGKIGWVDGAERIHWTPPPEM